MIATDSLATYPMGGGHWSWALQYGLGLVDLGYRVHWLELMPRLDDEAHQRNCISTYFQRLALYGFTDGVTLVVNPGGQSPLEDGEIVGSTLSEVHRLMAEADLLLDLANAVPQVLLARFGRTALLDADPGVTQASAVTFPEYRDEVLAHDICFTVGLNIGSPDCDVPTLGIEWHPVRPFVHLPSWPMADPSADRLPFATITHWNWGSVTLGSRVVDASKRLAYLRYAGLPLVTGERFHLSALIDHTDMSGDREVLLNHGWSIDDPHETVPSPEAYRQFIVSSAAEFACPKPVYRVLRSGWISDRSVCYLASGRPVVMEDTGIADHLPVGEGLLTFVDFDSAADAVRRVRRDYAAHAAAARRLAEEVFDSRIVLTEMMECCGL